MELTALHPQSSRATKFVSPLTHRPQPGFNPRTLGQVASMLTTRPPRTTNMDYVTGKTNMVTCATLYSLWSLGTRRQQKVLPSQSVVHMSILLPISLEWGHYVEPLTWINSIVIPTESLHVELFGYSITGVNRCLEIDYDHLKSFTHH